jgi:hypothetical protein
MMVCEGKRMASGGIEVEIAPVYANKSLHDTSWALLKLIHRLRLQSKSDFDLCEAAAWKIDSAVWFSNVVRKNPVLEAGQMEESLKSAEKETSVANSMQASTSLGDSGDPPILVEASCCCIFSPL